MAALALISVGQFAYADSVACSAAGPKDSDFPTLQNYRIALKGSEAEPLVREAAIQDFLDAGRFCRKTYNFYENRAKCSESWKLGIGVAGGVFGFVGAMLATAATGGAAPGIAAGLAGVASVTLGTAEKGPLGSGAYEARRLATQKTVEAGDKSFQSAKTAADIYQIAAGMAVSCPVPSQ
jgi:hypothetical protein